VIIVNKTSFVVYSAVCVLGIDFGPKTAVNPGESKEVVVPRVKKVEASLEIPGESGELAIPQVKNVEASLRIPGEIICQEGPTDETGYCQIRKGCPKIIHVGGCIVIIKHCDDIMLEEK
jgi:hypothetical protein